MMCKKLLNSAVETVMLWVIVLLAFWPEMMVVMLAVILAGALTLRESVVSVFGPTISTYSRGYFDFLEPDKTPLEIVDIALGLSNICRYGGQIARFYSVAEHSVHASCLVEPEYAYDALMHDAPEAVIGDMVKPLKEILPDYQVVETRVEESIFRQFGVSNPLPKQVKIADIQMLILEKEQLKGNFDEWSWCANVPRPPHIDMQCWTPAEGFSRFMARYSELRGTLGLAA